MTTNIAYRKVLIFGAGVAGQNAFHHVNEVDEVVGFIDNNVSKQGARLFNLPVISPQQVNQHTFDSISIASEFFEKIRFQLVNELHIDEHKVQVLPSSMLTPMSFGQDPQIRQAAEQILFCLGAELDAHQVDYFIDAGTLLGIYRDDELIPWDDDLDLAVREVNYEKILQVLPAVLKRLEAKTKGKWEFNIYYCDAGYGSIPKGAVRSIKLSNTCPYVCLPMVDIFVKYVSGENAEYSLASRGITVPSKHMFGLEKIKFRDRYLNVPADPEGYLEAYYGDWRTPVKDWDLSQIKNAQVY